MDHSATKNLVLTETHGQSTLVLKLNRPAKRNALSQALINSLLRELENASTDPRICSVVITGSDTIFSGRVGQNRIEGDLTLLNQPVPTLERSGE